MCEEADLHHPGNAEHILLKDTAVRRCGITVYSDQYVVLSTEKSFLVCTAIKGVTFLNDLDDIYSLGDTYITVLGIQH